MNKKLKLDDQDKKAPAPTQQFNLTLSWNEEKDVAEVNINATIGDEKMTATRIFQSGDTAVKFIKESLIEFGWEEFEDDEVK